MLSRAVGVQNILDQVTDLDNVSKSFMDGQVLNQDVSGVQSRENFSNITRELMKKDKELSKKKKVTFANVNNFANFNNYIAQNGVLETSVDKLAEIRSNVTNNATCELNKYGQTIGDVYDNLMSNPYMQYQKSCDTSKITGILEDKINNYESNGNYGGNYGGDYANV
jgi:malate synthase